MEHNEETVLDSELDELFPKSGLTVTDHHQIDDVDNIILQANWEAECDGPIPPETPEELGYTK